MFRLTFRLSSKILRTRRCCYETYTAVLKNGVRVAVEERMSALACISLIIKIGSRFELPENNGITHFIEHMAFKGFKSMNVSQLDDCLNSMGAKLDAFTTRENQLFTGLCLAEKSLDLISIMSRIVTDLEFSDYEMSTGKENILKELNDYENSPKHVVFDYLHQAAFQGTPLAQRVIGPVKNIERFDEHEASCFIREQYKPENIVLAVSGSVNHLDVISTAQKWFSHISSNVVTSNMLCRYTGSSIVYRDDSLPFAHVAIALEVPGYGHPDYWPLFVANCILGLWDRSQGGDETNAPYLARAAATSHLCEIYEPFYIHYQHIGLWGVYYVAEKTNLDGLLHNIQHQWMCFCTSITQPEVQRGINHAILRTARRIGSTFNSCQDMGCQVLYNGKRLSLTEIQEEIRKVDVNAIREVGDKYIYDKCPVVSAIGPTECLPDYSRLRAEMYWLRY